MYRRRCAAAQKRRKPIKSFGLGTVRTARKVYKKPHDIFGKEWRWSWQQCDAEGHGDELQQGAVKMPENEDLVLLFGFVAVIGENPAHYNRPIVTATALLYPSFPSADVAVHLMRYSSSPCVRPTDRGDKVWGRLGLRVTHVHIHITLYVDNLY
ncbi:hypothetical protein F2P81_018230 [Scophthalmus maximus]|uniref:Uncharacterized protein n=1 Tax=Scophthalmus maximus TaxID=52904 RepID=A0A6A4S9U3_SCOMX|nr:hypothetical protein F2P81_018230 [Scophthalmus maximus]